MSKLIETLYDEVTVSARHSIFDAWWIAKPLDSHIERSLINRLKDAWRVLTLKSYAYHYKAQESSK